MCFLSDLVFSPSSVLSKVDDDEFCVKKLKDGVICIRLDWLD